VINRPHRFTRPNMCATILTGRGPAALRNRLSHREDSKTRPRCRRPSTCIDVSKRPAGGRTQQQLMIAPRADPYKL
jgi:hypothetical protein